MFVKIVKTNYVYVNYECLWIDGMGWIVINIFQISTFFDFAVMIWNCATDLSPFTIHTTYLRKKKFKFHSMIRWLTCIWFPIIILECLYHLHSHFHEIISLLHLKKDFELLSNIKISIWLLESYSFKTVLLCVKNDLHLLIQTTSLFDQDIFINLLLLILDRSCLYLWNQSIGKWWKIMIEQ